MHINIKLVLLLCTQQGDICSSMLVTLSLTSHPNRLHQEFAI